MEKKYSHSWIFGCYCCPNDKKYASAEKISNLCGNRYRLINYIESRYYMTKNGKWLKSHVIHCDKCSNDENTFKIFSDKLIYCSGVFMT